MVAINETCTHKIPPVSTLFLISPLAVFYQSKFDQAFQSLGIKGGLGFGGSLIDMIIMLIVSTCDSFWYANLPHRPDTITLFSRMGYRFLSAEEGFYVDFIGEPT
jgi:hypothetical protein